MTDESSTAQAIANLLDEEQQVVLQNIARLGKDRTRGRAIALLALNEGATRAEAGEASGLTLGQIKYVLATFRQKGSAMFARYSFAEHQPPVEEVAPAEKIVATKKAKRNKKKKAKKEEPKGKGGKMAKNGKKLKKEKKEKAKGKGKKKGKKGKDGKKKGKK